LSSIDISDIYGGYGFGGTLLISCADEILEKPITAPADKPVKYI
jgi:hypothetical protein